MMNQAPNASVYAGAQGWANRMLAACSDQCCYVRGPGRSLPKGSKQDRALAGKRDQRSTSRFRRRTSASKHLRLGDDESDGAVGAPRKTPARHTGRIAPRTCGVCCCGFGAKLLSCKNDTYEGNFCPNCCPRSSLFADRRNILAISIMARPLMPDPAYESIS
jgi:hypothetical protein